MAKRAKTFREEVTNTHDQLIRWKIAGLQARPVGITRANLHVGRSSWRDGWHIYSPWGRTDPDGHWQHNGSKHIARPSGINGMAGDKAALEIAITWANHYCGMEFEWVRNRMGEYVPKELNDMFPLRKI